MASCTEIEKAPGNSQDLAESDTGLRWDRECIRITAIASLEQTLDRGRIENLVAMPLVASLQDREFGGRSAGRNIQLRDNRESCSALPSEWRKHWTRIVIYARLLKHSLDGYPG